MEKQYSNKIKIEQLEEPSDLWHDISKESQSLIRGGFQNWWLQVPQSIWKYLPGCF